jgi:hypothetical protein
LQNWRNLSWGSKIFFSDTLRSSGNTPRGTPNLSDRPIDLSPSDPFLIPLLKDLDGVSAPWPVRLNPSIPNPQLLTPALEGDDSLESKSSNLRYRKTTKPKKSDAQGKIIHTTEPLEAGKSKVLKMVRRKS